MGSTLMGVDVVCESENRLVVGAGPLQGHLQFGVVGHVHQVDDVRVERLPLGVEMVDEVDQAAFVEELVLTWFLPPLVSELDGDAAIEESCLPQTCCDDVVVEGDGLFEDLGARPEADGRSGSLDGLALLGLLGLRLSVLELLGIEIAVASHLRLETLRQCVDHGYTDTVKAARDRVGALLEFASSMEGGQNRGQG